MKVTKGETKQETRKVIAFYVDGELVFRAYDSDKNYVLSGGNYVHEGGLKFDDYLESSKSVEGFIAFCKGDTINIQL